MRSILLLVLAGLLMAGCGIARRAEEKERYDRLVAEVDAAVAACNSRTPRAAWARCVNEAQRPIIQTVPVEYRDLYELKAAGRLALAARLDRGEIRQEDAELETAKMNSNLMAEFNRRQLARRAVDAQETAAMAAADTAARSRLPVRCTRFGDTVQCF